MKETHLFLRSLPALAAALAVATLHAGSVARLVYDDITGTAVSALTNAASFPDSPTFREQLDDFTLSPGGLPVFGLQSKDNFGSNFGGWVRGYLEAPADGTYHFFISSDDASELRLSTDHTPANQRRIAFEASYGAPLFSGDRLAERRSGPVALVKGQKYYFETLFKQGTGASYLQVGWQRPDGVQEVIPARHLAQHPLDPFFGRTEPNLPPTFNALGANGGDLPPVTSADEGGEVVLELDVIAAQPTTITWRRGGTVIPGENLSFLKLSRVSAALNGQTIQAVVANAYGQLTTASSRLSITPDQTAPTVVAVDHRGNPNALTVVFSEPVSAATATALANYELRRPGGSALPIHSAVLLPDERTVQLAGDFHFAVNARSLLTVRDIDDQAATPNRLTPNPTTVTVEFQGEFLGPVAFDAAHPLQDLAVLENRIARFEAALTGAKPWFYQWIRNGTALPGATNRVLEVPATAATAGDYQVEVSNEFSIATSTVAQLTVSPDLEPARILAIRGLAGVDTIRLTFDEALTVESATNPANYGLEGVPVLGAVLSADQRTVTLHTGPLQRGHLYLVSVIGLHDIAVAGNVLSGTGSFVAEVDYPGEVLADGPVRYWRFDETTGNTVASLSTGLDAPSGTAGTLVNSPELGVTGLVPGSPENTAVRLAAASSQRVTVPNGSDLNANVGPWAKKSFEFWFRAASAPAPDTTGLAATAGIWEQGAATRNIAVYLWRDPAKPDPNEAELVFHAFNNASDGPGAPFGLTTQPAVFVQYTVVVGQTYHVVAVFDGDTAGLNGHLILYVNGAEVGRVGGVGQIYNHTGDVQIGRGNGIIHTGENGNLGFFDGVLDDLSVYSKALTPERAAAHYQAGLGNTGGSLSALAVARVDNRGNPNLALVTFTKPVAPAGAATAANYALTTSTGTAIPITSATLLPGDLTVQLTGAFNFQAGSNYTLVVKDVADAANPAQGLNPNPTTVPFTFAVNGAVGIGAGSELASRTAFENESVTFRIVASGTGPFRYQWFRNGVALPGEVRPELRVTATAATLGNYTVRVDNDFSQLTTAPTNLSLDVDFWPPRVLAIVGVAGTVNQVRLTFDEALDPVTAVYPGTYSLGAIPVLSASLGGSGLDLTLRTGPLQHGQNYTLAITGLKDRAAAANTLTTSVPFAAGASYRDEILADAPVRYWRFEETSGVTAATLTANLDAVNTAAATYVNAPQLGVPGLVPNLPGDVAVRLSAAASQRLTVPNGLDLNATAGPWAKRTVQLWFRATSVPAPDATGLAAVAGLWEEGGASRSLAIYLWRDPANTNPNEAELVLHALNNVADGPGSPYGPPNDPAVFVQTTVKTGQTYHVVGVFDGDPAGLNGNLVLYVNGVEAGRRPGIGQLYNHTADIQIGQGNALNHLGDNGAFAFFDGVIDEVAVYNQVLPAERIAQLHAFGLADPTTPDPGTPPAFTGVEVVGTNLVLTWDGPATLEWAPVLGETFTAIPAASSPYQVPTTAGPAGFFRLKR